MAVSVSRAVPPFVPGAGRISVTDVTLDSSYATGGLALTPAQLGLNQVDSAICGVKATSVAGAVASAAYDVANQKIKALTTTAEVASTTDCSAVVITVVAFGR